MVQLFRMRSRVAEVNAAMAPPFAARLPVNVQPVNVALPPARKTAPPLLVPASPLVNVTLLAISEAELLRVSVSRKKRNAGPPAPRVIVEPFPFRVMVSAAAVWLARSDGKALPPSAGSAAAVNV